MPKRQRSLKSHKSTPAWREMRHARLALGPRASGKMANSTVSKATRTRRRFL